MTRPTIAFALLLVACAARAEAPPSFNASATRVVVADDALFGQGIEGVRAASAAATENRPE